MGSVRRSALIVEDDADQRFIVQSLLESGGYDVHACPTLHDSLDLLESVPFDVVVLDLTLPDHAGGDRAVEVLQSVSATPVVVYSAASETVADAVLGAGASSFVPKSAGLDSLSAAIEGVFAAGGPVRTRALPQPDGVSPDLVGTTDFAVLAQRTVDALVGLSGIGTWMVTRVISDDWRVLAIHDHTYGIATGDVLSWSDSVCSRMAQGIGPTVEPVMASNERFRTARVVADRSVEAYVGMPLVVEDDGLFGTLCGLSPVPHPDPDALARLEPMFRMTAQLLSSALGSELRATRVQRRLDIAHAAATSDLLTGLGNRRSWERAVRFEDERCDRYGHAAGVIAIDLDGLKEVNDRLGHAYGDRLLRDAATALGSTIREVDSAYRVGGDEFLVLMPEIARDDLAAAVRRIDAGLEAASVPAAVGAALRDTGGTLARAAVDADAAMYRDKRLRKSSSS